MPDANVHLREYQRRRIDSIHAWYDSVAAPTNTEHVDSSVQYLLLWVTFNALYNVADMPERRLLSPSHTGENPRIRGSREDKKLRNIADRLSADKAFIARLIVDNKIFITSVTHRRPSVSQPDETDPITYEVNGKTYSFVPSEIRGFASFDNRYILESGHKVYEHSSLDGQLRPEENQRDRKAFTRQLIFLLYQIRNNIAHGGSAAFFRRGNKVAKGAIEVLDAIVRHLLDDPRILLDEAPSRPVAPKKARSAQPGLL